MPRIVKTFSYFPYPFLDPHTHKLGNIYRPVIPMKLSYGHRITKSSLYCLVDSGADNNLFPAEWGLNIGIPIEKGDTYEINGIGNIGVKTYRHNIRLYMGTDIIIDTIADFSPFQEIPLLGRQSFFCFFERLSFDEKHRTLELEYFKK